MDDLHRALTSEHILPTAYLYAVSMKGRCILGRCLRHLHRSSTGEFADDHRIRTSSVVSYSIRDGAMVVKTLSGSTYVLLNYSEGWSLDKVTTAVQRFITP